MNQAGLILVFGLSFAAFITAQDNRQCLDNPTGTLSVDVRGVPGPEGPRGERGPKGSTGGEGRRGFQGKTGERGLQGDIGPMAIKGMTGQTGAIGQKGRRGNRGPLGPTGAPGIPGLQGIQGEPGDTVLNEEELDRVREMVDEAINASIIERLASMRCNCCNKSETTNAPKTTETTEIPEVTETTKAPETTEVPKNNSTTLCGISSANWARVAYLDTTQGQTCPPALRTFTNTTTNQSACGTQHTTNSISIHNVSMTFPTNRRYTHVCGRVRGYVYGEGYAFYPFTRGQRTIDSNYVDGVSITMGSPRQHLWTYAMGSETYDDQGAACPCARSNYVASNIPDFIGNQHYCESAFVGVDEQRIAWEDALWDGMNCVTEGNTCCDRFGWFHREVAPTQDFIEVRWMKYYSSAYSEVMIDQGEIWVL